METSTPEGAGSFANETLARVLSHLLRTESARREHETTLRWQRQRADPAKPRKPRNAPAVVSPLFERGDMNRFWGFWSFGAVMSCSSNGT